ncbi:zinc ribbon domain-containing protein [Halorientalis pallida]|uniref:zinc ribbon domain-containing protein n=1 Tax=Halorientalis pallida TaxID=2479928 RepID=UPI001D114F32|nr:zinc ribbon domain-containing protein [Halorientalis pallida]
MPDSARKRPLLAAVLGLVYPGLGHVYLREWARALLWFGLIILTGSLMIPDSAIPTTLTVDSLMQMSRAMPLRAVVALSAVTGMNMVDAYVLASRTNETSQRVADGTQCPSCGREVDSDLEFCHWCTTKLDAGDAEEN